MTINCTDNFTIDLNMLGRIELDFPIVDDTMFVNLTEIDEVRECDFICHYIAYSQMSNFYGSVVTVKAEKGETQNTREKLGVDCTSRMCFNRDNLARIAKRKIFDPDFKNSDIDKCVQTIKREVLDFTYYLDKANMNSVFADMYSILVTFDKDFNLDKCWLINTTTRFPELPIYPKDDILCETLGIRSYLDLPELKKILKDFLEKGILPNV